MNDGIWKPNRRGRPILPTRTTLKLLIGLSNQVEREQPGHIELQSSLVKT